MGHQSREQSEHIALCHFNVVDTKLSDSLWITPSKGVQQLDPYLSIDGQIGVRAPMRTGCVLMCTERTIAGMLSRFPNAEPAISPDRHIPTVIPSGMVAVGHAVTHACKEIHYNVMKFITKQGVTFGGYAPARDRPPDRSHSFPGTPRDPPS